MEALQTLQAPRLDRRRLDDLAAGRLAETLTWGAQTAFYARRMREAGIDSLTAGTRGQADEALNRLPPVTKHVLRAAGDAVLCGGTVAPHWHSSYSSGSTGEPFRVYYDRRAWLMLKYLVKSRGRRLCGVDPLDRIAVLDAIQPDRLARGLLERLGQLRTFSVFEPPTRLAERLASFAPAALYGLPSALLETARAADDAGKRIRPESVFTSGELLTDSVREELQHRLATRVYDVYGCSETKEIAFECRAGRLHINMDVVYVEVLDDDARPVPTGEEGHITVTLLVNRAMPLIRYQPGDRGSLSKETCPCGLPFPTLGVVTGRTVDVLVLGNGARISPYALTCAVEGIVGIRRFQLRQAAPDRIDVRIIADPGVDRGAIARQVAMKLKAATAPQVAVTVTFVDTLPHGPRGKFQVVQGAQTSPV